MKHEPNKLEGVKLPKFSFRFKPSNWIVIPLGLVAMFCLYLSSFYTPSILHPPNPPYYVFLMPTLVYPLLALFGGIYIYSTLKRKQTGLATAIAYLFCFVFALYFIGPIFGKGYTCIGLFSVPTDCSEANQLTFAILFLSPFSFLLGNILACTGVVSLLLRVRSRFTSTTRIGSNNLRKPEKVILGYSAVASALGFAGFGTYYPVTWILFLVMVADAILIFTNIKPPETLKRFILLVSLVGAAIVSYYMINAWMGPY